jgi:hypothetical protein
MSASPLRLLPLLALVAACATTTTPIPDAWMSVPEAARVAGFALSDDGKITPAAPPKSQGPIRVHGGRLMNGEKELTEAFPAIDSFDYSEARGEVVFSARRTDNFDVGLVSSDGSPIVWIPSADPSDEIAVQWAPRGNKVSYIVRAKGGDVVRTVHIPTSANVVTDFPGATIRVLVWEPQAERFAVAYSTPDASESVEIVKYDGSARKMATPPATTLDVDVQPFAKDAILLRPREVRYDEKVPLVLWVASDFAWSDARAALMKNARVAVVITKRAPDDELWKAAAETPWVDGERVFVVNPQQQPVTRNPKPITIVSDATLPPNHYRRSGAVVSVPPTVIQSFSAGFIADHLKRTAPANGRSR